MFVILNILVLISTISIGLHPRLMDVAFEGTSKILSPLRRRRLKSMNKKSPLMQRHAQLLRANLQRQENARKFGC